MTSDATTFWDEHYGRRSQVWSGRPNTFLVEETSDLVAGRALDLGCGEGADAMWLAERGWHVTAVDVSQTALERGARLAEKAGLAARIDWQRHDLGATFPDGSYDLVSAQFFQSPIELPREEILRKAADAVAPGGTLLVVSHASGPPWAAHAAPAHAFPDPVDDARALGLDGDGWDLLFCGVREREATGPAGEHGTLSDGLVQARRSTAP